LQNGDQRFKFCQLIAVLLNKAHGFLRLVQTLLNFINPVSERFIRQQVQARQKTVEL
jgi:hypothetical protein